MKIIFFSIFVLRLRICSRHKCRFYAECGQLLRESGQFECWDGDGKRKELGGYDGNEKGWFAGCKRLDGRGTKRNSYGGCKLLCSGTTEQ